ncbi:hypothetical protein [Ancylobacter sp. G4_0304]|uniref:hypothetical protein n=1 Tax=Ancylobacter sp. G4_0304 TaxID=3114289 RepID=UPI0039C68780
MNGSIPVILADMWQPPGPKELWEEAVVFCAEAPDAIRALPDRLATLADDKNVIRRKREALKRLLDRYGPDNFVHDILALFPSAAKGA